MYGFKTVQKPYLFFRPLHISQLIFAEIFLNTFIMDKKLIPLLIFLLFLFLPVKADITNPVCCVVTLTQNANPDSGERNEKDSRHYRRLPSRSIECTISTTDGVIIPGVDTSDILSYEIYDVEGICIGIFSDADDFVSYLFSQNGSFEVRFTTDEYIFLGYIDI